MKKIPPSEQMRQAMQDFLRQGIEGSEQPTSQLLQLAAQLVLQQALEAEVSDFLGRERYERHREEQRGYRNGY